MVTFIRAIDYLFQFIEILIIVRIFMNIFRVSLDNILGQAIVSLTDPILAPAQMIMHKLGLDRGMIDFSPWVAILFLRLILYFIINLVR